MILQTWKPEMWNISNFNNSSDDGFGNSPIKAWNILCVYVVVVDNYYFVEFTMLSLAWCLFIYMFIDLYSLHSTKLTDLLNTLHDNPKIKKKLIN